MLKIFAIPFLVVYQIWASMLFIIIVSSGTFISILLGVFIPNKGKLTYKMICIVSKCWFFVIGNRVQNIYLDQQASQSLYKKNFLIIANHKSFIDIPTLYTARLPWFLFLSKEEILKIPLLGYLCKHLAVTVQRRSRRSKHDSLEKMAAKIKVENANGCIFPEGTFNTSNRSIIDFHLGAFSLAIRLQIPIYPVLLLDASSRLTYKAKLPFSPGKSRVVHLPPITKHLSTNLNASDLREYAQTAMTTSIEKFKCIKQSNSADT